MKPVLPFVIAAFFATMVGAQTDVPPQVSPGASTGEALDLSQFRWKNRLLVIFADSPGDPQFVEQMGLLEIRVEDLVERDVIVLIDTAPTVDSELREKFRPRGFMLVLIGKDSNVYLRKPRPWDTREISRSIDKMPLRRQEMRK
ncbi:DUF4174 domain-containing protein [Alisedimentitalea sp. MJ-SS2]|uniref:DUF4174 domain-containing protein n=1 Tax=Aliisedimentitalea sp. MJ-SS2 TaxID=3049795 RepID=UPI0029061A9D|nr:DUF4174 domain-containing protein [Alisedimentitalea sp. MJ-SS2]MDU8926638.1 DUF4174 domain-containing protein [Alisedimentitalea sp. MJ-SS2]